MTKSDTQPLVTSGDIPAALGLLTRLPVRVDSEKAANRGAAAAWAYPLIGAFIGVIAALIAAGTLALGLPETVVAVFIIATQIILTGAMHEDGLADCADGFWGGWDPARRLAIMKDSQIGTYGVLALGLSLMLRWVTLTALLSHGSVFAILVCCAMGSRAAMVGVMAVMTNARDGGLSRAVGRPSYATASIAALVSGVAVILAFGTGAILMIIVACALAIGTGLVARAKIGGQTGDVLGATQQITEIGILLAALYVLAA